MIITKKYLKKLIKEQLNEQKINEQFLSFEQQKWVIKNALFNLNKLRNDVSQEMRNLKKSKLDNFPSQEFRGTQKQLNGLDNIIKTLSDRNLSDSKKINFLKNYPNLKIELPNIYKTFLNSGLFEQTLYDPHQSTIDRRMYANTLKQGQNILKYPSQREIDHEIMRIKTLWMNRPAQYELRLTKITNPQKMYNAYISIMAWLKINPEYRKNMEKILDKVRWYLRKNGYEDMLVGKGGNVPISLRESRLRSKKIVNENISSMQWTTKDFPIGAKVIATDLFGGNRPTLKGSVVKVTSDTVYIKTNDGIKPAGSLSYEIVLEGKTPIRESKLKSLIKRLINEQISSEVNEERYQLEVMSFVKDKNLNRVKSKLSYDTRLKNFEGDGNPDDTNKHLDNGFYSFYYYFLNSGDALNFAKKIINNFDEHVSVIVTDTERNKIIFQDETLDQQTLGKVNEITKIN